MQVREQVFALLNSLSPDDRKNPEFDALRLQVQEHIDAIDSLVAGVRGEPLNGDRILRDSSADPVIESLAEILESRVGSRWSSEVFSQMVQEGRRRFDAGIPPGFADANKTGQVEEGTGDYLMWEQTLQHLSESGANYSSFAVVTGDSKEDWRQQHPDGKGALGVLPELVAEAAARTGKSFLLLRPTDFYRLASAALAFDEDRTESLLTANEEVQATNDQSVAGQDSDSVPWSLGAYRMLLRRLAAGGYDNQRQAIRRAASRDGFISRDHLFELAGFNPERSLVRFAMPAVRIATDMVGEGELSPASEAPLWAEYNGPGKAVGYSVPVEFCSFEKLDVRLSSDSAADGMAGERWGPERVSDLASQFGVAATDLLAHLRSRGVFIPSITSPLSPKAIQILREAFGEPADEFDEPEPDRD
jgi:hypothetical protein